MTRTIKYATKYTSLLFRLDTIQRNSTSVTLTTATSNFQICLLTCSAALDRFFKDLADLNKLSPEIRLEHYRAVMGAHVSILKEYKEKLPKLEAEFLNTLESEKENFVVANHEKVSDTVISDFSKLAKQKTMHMLMDIELVLDGK